MRLGPTRQREWEQHARVAWLCLGIVLLAASPRLIGGEYYLGDERLGTRTAPLLLLTRADVQADLKLSPEQAASALQTIAALHKQAEALRGQPDTSEVIDARRAIDQSQNEWLRTHLSVTQQTRLLQIDIQWEGPSALLTRAVLAESLGLNADQRQRLARAITARRRQRSQGETDPAAERQLAETTLATLTDDQRERWKTMLGPPFVVRSNRARDPAVQTTTTR